LGPSVGSSWAAWWVSELATYVSDIIKLIVPPQQISLKGLPLRDVVGPAFNISPWHPNRLRKFPVLLLLAIGDDESALMI
jgi:hypothetical protein